MKLFKLTKLTEKEKMMSTLRGDDVNGQQTRWPGQNWPVGPNYHRQRG